MTDKPTDVNSREYWERAVSNPVGSGQSVRQLQAMKESFDLTDPGYWEKVMANPDAFGFAPKQAARLAEFFLHSDSTNDDSMSAAEKVEADAGFHEGIWGPEKVRSWLSLGMVLPFEAALLLAADRDPSLYVENAVLPDMGDEFRLMNREFADVARDGKDRRLHEWIAVADERGMAGIGLEGWNACCTVFQVSAGQTPAPVVAESASGATTWAVTKPQRYHGYSSPLHRFLAAAQREGKPRPSARDAVEEWRTNPPAEIAQVLPDGINYYDSKGNTRPADIEAIRKAIDRMTRAR